MRNADDLQMPSAPPPAPAASCVLAYLRPSLPPLFDIPPPNFDTRKFEDDYGADTWLSTVTVTILTSPELLLKVEEPLSKNVHEEEFAEKIQVAVGKANLTN